MFKLRMILVMLIFAALMIVPAPGFTSTYLIGTGIYDITGPAAECGMMGYFMPDQVTEGIHTRLRSRAFVVVDPRSGKRVALVIAEAGIIPQGINQAVVKKLLTKYNGLYTDQN
ncbi:MAG TPA: neutral/alkaline non-lysosomal ceramidase N-terminal domain-containing protein, partial [Smithella sp.]|nr:neutral/alkaline non-lysosomal ceramidase N-terminal domain-containing protein [Smithella sp.]